MRTFFALDLAPSAKLAFEEWRSNNLPFIHRPVPMANFHITLAFLGDTPDKQMEKLAQGANTISGEPVGFHVNDMGYWSRPGIVWLGSKDASAPLNTLAHQCQALGARLGLQKEDKRYHPHISLFRKVETPPPVALTEPDFHLTFKHFCLMASIPARDGVQYRELARWPLHHKPDDTLSIREQLARGQLN